MKKMQYNNDEIIFSIGDNEKIKITKKGFYLNGNTEPVTNDKKIYDQFKNWLDYTLNGMKDEK